MAASLMLIALVSAGAVLWMLFFYGLRRATGNIGIIDIGWSWGVGLAALACAGLGSGDPHRRLLLALFAGAWSFRLGVFLLRDRVFRGREDGRYLSLMASWGEQAERRLFRLFLFQALFIVLFALPFLPVADLARPLFTLWDVAAVFVWIMAVSGESVADRQLARWRADPGNKGHTCRSGLWHYSRHPNYFFEWLHWWTYVLLAAGSSWWCLTLLGPALMFYILYRVTGIPYNEAQSLRSRGEDYAHYQRTTSAFFPWFPHREEQ